MSRDHILHKVRTALGRSAAEPPGEAPAPWLRVPESAVDDRVESFCAALEKLAGKTYRAVSRADAREYVERLIAGRKAVASPAALLVECGITGLTGVESGFHDKDAWRAACAAADIGITAADYALADTGTLVMLASSGEPRLLSLLPPMHVAVLARERLLTGLDELFTLLPVPSAATSSLVFITGPSRTADIEQILVRGVHGPGEIHVVLV